MPVLAERRKMTKEELEAIIPYILEIRQREQIKEIDLLNRIRNFEEENQKNDEDEDKLHAFRLQQIKIQEDHLETVRKHIEEQETMLANLQKEKLELFEMFKKSLQKKHEQQLQQQQQHKLPLH